MDNQNYQRAKTMLNYDKKGLGLFILYAFIVNLIVSILQNFTIIGALISLVLSIAILPLMYIIYDLYYLKRTDVDLATVLTSIIEFWQKGWSNLILAYIVFLLKALVVIFGLVFLNIFLATILIANAGFMGILIELIIIGISIFAGTYFMSIFAYEINYKIIAIYFDKTMQYFSLTETPVFAIKCALWSIVPVVGWVMVIIKGFIFNLKLMFDVLDNEE